MFRDLMLNRSKMRLVLLAIGILGLAVSVTMFFVSQTSRQQDLAKTRTAPDLAVRSTIGNGKLGQGSFGITGMTIEDSPAVSGTEMTTANPVSDSKAKEVRKRSRRNPRSGAHNQIASRFPAPALAAGNSDFGYSQPRSQVEMWSGSKETIVRVPKGSKFVEFE